MSFVQIIRRQKLKIDQSVINENTGISEKPESQELVEKAEPVKILRNVGYKIKMVTPTSFGTQIDLFKMHDKEEVQELLKDFTIKIKNKSIFIVD